MSFDPRIRNWEDYQRVYSYSLKEPDLFWAAVALYKLHWRKTWSQVSDWDFKTAQVKWYLGAQLNVCENCLDRHVEAGKGDQKALVWIGNSKEEQRSFTFKELLREVCRMANALEARGIKKGDRVLIYLPNIPELAISVLACARLGVVHSVVFGGFSAHSIQSRANDCGAKLILTSTGTFRGEKWIHLKATVDEAMKLGCPTVEKVIVLKRDLIHSAYVYEPQPYDVLWDELIHSKLKDTHQAVAHDAEDPLFILYTSGSTGQPKGVLHTMGGYLTYVAYSFEIVFQPHGNDVYWCTADIGWITGHSYVVYGPLVNGITTLMYEGVPTYPDPGRFWEIVEQFDVSIFYSAPTAIRILASHGKKFVEKYSRKSLRTLGTVGEPINPEAWKWYSEIVGEGRIPIVDTWWQTETGGILISPLAGITPTKPGSATLPLPGIDPQLLDEKGNELLGVAEGTLVIARSWPGQMRQVYGDSNRFRETYFSQHENYFTTGDGARRDDEGYYWILGRMDDVIKVSGHRLGTAEIESACMTHPRVAEAAAVGVPDPVTGEALRVFVVLKQDFPEVKESKDARYLKPELNDTQSLQRELMEAIRIKVGAVAKPQGLDFVPGLPKTRSGKIMRRILKKIALGQWDALGDVSTLADPGIVDKIISARQDIQMVRICIVDDDEALRGILVLFFKSLGLKDCIAAGSLSELEAQVKSIPDLDIAFLDVNLGEGQPDGLAVYQWLCKNQFVGRAVFISGHARSDPKIDAICKTPGTSFLEKPFDVDELKALIKKEEEKA